jgi:RNA polymerase sigma-70 factor (ECF subfamily)
MTRVRAGDAEAAAQLVRHYEPHIRRVVRVRLTSPALKRQVDHTDICQSVLGDFFVRAALGQFDLNSPEQLIKLLAVMTRNKLVDQVEKHHAARRDVRRVEHADVGEFAVAANGETPSRIVAGRELLSAFRGRLTDEERYLADQRAQGRAWQELAVELRMNVDALRKRLTRAVDRVSAELGLETMGDVPL